MTERQEVVMAREMVVSQDGSLELFACPNADCCMLNRFGAGNLSVVEHIGKGKAIRRLYCNHCQQRFSERRGSLMQYTHLPQETVVRVLKCLTYGCSQEATADICEVDGAAWSGCGIAAAPGPRIFISCSWRSWSIRRRLWNWMNCMPRSLARRRAKKGARNQRAQRLSPPWLGGSQLGSRGLGSCLLYTSDAADD